MRFLLIAASLMTLLTETRAQDAASCDRIFNDSTAASGLQKYDDAALDQSLCVASKLVLQATMNGNKALSDSCVPAMSAVMREFMRRGRDSHEARQRCAK